MTTRKSISKKVYDITDKVIQDMKNRGFEDREGQVNIMYTVISAFESRENMLIEAGVGIGKSFGYLIPGTLISFFTGKPMIIATSTIQLTEQLNADIETVKKLLDPYLKDRNVKSVIGKGRDNYPCICTVENKINKTGERVYTDILDKIGPGVDRQNPNGIPKKYWNVITKHECNSTKGFDRNNCYFYQMRTELTKESVARDIERIFDPRVLVVNQDLLVNHYKNIENGKKPILHENPCLLIIDELHNLEEKTRTALTKKIDIRKSLNTLHQANILANTGYTKDEIIVIEKKIEKIYEFINQEVQKQINNNNPLLLNEKITIESYELQLDSVITQIRNVLTEFALSAKPKDYYVRGMYRKIENDLEELIVFLQAFSNSNNDYVTWAEIDSMEKGDFSVFYCPGNIGQTLNQNIFKKSIPIVGMSATITSKFNEDNPYEYIIENIGFDEDKGTWEYPEESEFDYDKSRIFIPESLPDIRKRGNKDYYASINKIIKNIYSNCKGGCLVLFTAKYDMQEVYSKLKDDLNTPIYLDNDTLTPNEIIGKFEESKGIILSAGSFWEGIDLKGKLLTNLIIVRLPFPVPDPVIKNKIKRLGSSDIVLGPEMIMKLKQGTGRLIRSKTDIGLVSILDSRMNERTNKYRDIIYKELPFKNYITQWEEAKKFQLDNEL